MRIVDGSGARARRRRVESRRSNLTSTPLVLGVALGLAGTLHVAVSSAANKPESMTLGTSPTKDEEAPPADRSRAGSPRAEEKTEPSYEHRPIGFVFTALTYTGMGGGLRLGTEMVGLLATATAQSLFVWSVQEEARERGDYSPEFKFLQNGQINLDGYLAFGRRNARFRIGGAAGFRHNTLLQNGFAVGAYGLFNVRPDIAVQLQIGMQYFPDGDRSTTVAINRCEQRAMDPDAPCGLVPLWDAGIQPGLSIGLLFFP